MRKTITLLFLHFAVQSLYAQELGRYSRIDLGINGMAFIFEMPIVKNLTVEPTIGFGPSYEFNTDEDALTKKINWRWAILEPSFHASVYTKYFYNRNKRLVKGKSLALNSGSYFGEVDQEEVEEWTDEIVSEMLGDEIVEKWRY